MQQPSFYVVTQAHNQVPMAAAAQRQRRQAHPITNRPAGPKPPHPALHAVGAQITDHKPGVTSAQGAGYAAMSGAHTSKPVLHAL
jgi:hypothetical protein